MTYNGAAHTNRYREFHLVFHRHPDRGGVFGSISLEDRI